MLTDFPHKEMFNFRTESIWLNGIHFMELYKYKYAHRISIANKRSRSRHHQQFSYSSGFWFFVMKEMESHKVNEYNIQ